ncbi:MAG: hypothetical protein WCX08_00155 [Candidatus Buchananbacteria bacterium]
MNYLWFKLILALILIWPRGYLLVYVIDRAKNFDFGFKFFAGWIFGLAAFTIDLFSANVFGGFKLNPWLFYFSVISQVFGLEAVIFLFERKLLWPKFENVGTFFSRQKNNFLSWSKNEYLILVILALSFLVSGIFVWQVNVNSAADNSAQLIFNAKTISLAEIGLKNYPLNGSLAQVWLAEMAGRFTADYSKFLVIFYYFIILAVFYTSLPKKISRFAKLLSVYFLSNLPLLFFYFGATAVDWVFAIFLFLTLANFFYYLTGRGNSFFYFSGIAMAFSVWTRNDGLVLIFPLFVLATLVLLLIKKIKLSQWLLFWFWPVVTVSSWLSFIFANHLNIFRIYFADFSFADLRGIIAGFLPLIFLFLALFFIKIFGKINLYGKS